MSTRNIPYLDGLILFLLLAAFLLADRVASTRAMSAAGLCLLVAIAGMLVAPSLDRHQPWLNYWSLAARLAPKTVESFNWSQTYGPLNWPRRGTTVLEIKARAPEYWKTEDLDVFDGQGWTQGLVPGQQNTPSPDRRWLTRWSQTIQVTLRDMQTSDVVGAGVSSQPASLSATRRAPASAPAPGPRAPQLEPGDSYRIRVYAPQPTPAQLHGAGADYAGLPAGLPDDPASPARSGRSGDSAAAQIVFPTFHSEQAGRRT